MTRDRTNFVRARECAGDDVLNALNLGVRQRGADELEFAAAGLSVFHRHAEDGAVVLGDAVSVAILERGHVRDVSVFVQDSREFVNSGLERCEALESCGGVFQAAFAAAREDALEEFRVVVADVIQEFVGEVVIGAGVKGVGGFGEAVGDSGSSDAFADFAAFDQAVSLEAAEVLACAAGSDAGFGGEFVRAEFAASFEGVQHDASRFRHCLERGVNVLHEGSIANERAFDNKNSNYLQNKEFGCTLRDRSGNPVIAK
jgi:hypothetical protein